MKKYVVAFALIVPLVAVYILTGARMTIVATQSLEIWSDWREEAVDRRVIAILEEGSELPVLRCIDLKSDIIPEVKLVGGDRGYVLKGKFRLVRHPLFGKKGGALQHICYGPYASL